MSHLKIEKKLLGNLHPVNVYSFLREGKKNMSAHDIFREGGTDGSTSD
jgi:hypothetical protein